MPISKPKIVKVIRRWLFDGVDGESVRVLALRHVGDQESGAGRVVRSFHHPWNMVEGEGKVDALVTALLETVEDDAGEQGGTQKYVIEAYSGESSTEPSESAALTVNVRRKDVDEDLGIGPSEKPNGTGLVSMTMRHLENRDRISAGTTMSMFQQMSNMVESQRMQLNAMEERRLEERRLYEDMLSQAHDRKIRERESEFRQEILRDLANYGKAFVPAILNKVANEKILPEHTPPERKALGFFFDSCDPDEWASMMAALSSKPHLVMMLNSLLDDHLKGKEKAEGTYKGDRPFDDAPALVAPNGSGAKGGGHAEH